MKQNLFALFAAAALLLGMSACTNDDNPSSGQEDVVVAPAQLKQGIWTEYDEALLTSGKYTLEELALMPTVGMWIEGDKGYFFTYTAEEVSETVEGKISYDNKTGKGTITFPAIKESPLSGQIVNFTATSDETMEFEYTYEGKKTTGTCAWLCENLDNWSSDITDEDWKALMDYYQLIAADWGPDASIDWNDSDVDGLDEPLVWNDEVAATRAGNRVAPMAVAMGMNVLFSLFMPDPFEEVNAKLDAITGKLDQVLAGQEKILNQMNLRFDQMDQKLNEINARLIAIAEKQNQQETVNIFNKRNETYFNPLKVRNTSYFDDAYKLYVDNKDDLAKVSATLGKYAEKWVGSNNEYINLTWQYMEYLTTVQHSTYGIGMDHIYDGLTFDKYPWEHMGTGDRMNYRAYDMFMITKCLFMISLYSTYCGLDDIDKKALYNNYKTYKPKLNEFCAFKVANPDEFLVCQIPGAHFVMHKQLQKYYYKGKNNEAPHPAIYGKLAVYRPEWHEAGDIKIDNPAEMKSKLISWKEIFAMQKYYKSAANIRNIAWSEMLVEGREAGNNLAGGAVYAKKPTTQLPNLLLNNPEYLDPDEIRCDGVRAAGNELYIGPRATAFWENGNEFSMRNCMMGFANEPQNGKSLWSTYNSYEEYYAAIVEQRY